MLALVAWGRGSGIRDQGGGLGKGRMGDVYRGFGRGPLFELPVAVARGREHHLRQHVAQRAALERRLQAPILGHDCSPIALRSGRLRGHAADEEQHEGDAHLALFSERDERQRVIRVHRNHQLIGS